MNAPGSRSQAAAMSTLAVPVAAARAVPDDHDRKLAIGCLGVVLLVVAVSTPVHYLLPDLLRVPAEPVSPQAGFLFRLGTELTDLLLAALCAVHCWRNFGRFATVLFLIGSFLFTGGLENLMVLGGRFGLIPYPTYFFNTGGLLIFGDIPVSVCMSWFVLAYGTFFVCQTVFPRLNGVATAALCGLFCTDLDLWVDPIMTLPANRGWTWLQQPGTTTMLFGVPLNNFLGWFGVIFSFELLWMLARRWEEQVGQRQATKRFFLGVLVCFVGYGALVIGGELLIQAWLPGVSIDLGIDLGGIER